MALIGVRLIDGVMGGGKTYYMTKVMRTALQEGAQVHTNVDLHFDKLADEGFGEQLVDLRGITIEKMQEKIRPGHESRPNILCIDEAALDFYVDDQNDKSEKDRLRSVLHFLTWARRFGLEIYFATQSTKNINVKLRRMSEFRIRCSNLTQAPYFGWLWTFLLGTFRHETYGTTEEKDTLLYTTFCRYDPLVGASYDTHGFAGKGDERTAATMSNAMVTRKIPKRRDQTQGKIAFCILLVIAIYAVYLFGRFIYRVMHPKPVAALTGKGSETKVSGEATQQAGLRAVFYARYPRPLVITQDRTSYYIGAGVGGKIVTDIRDYGSAIIVTHSDKTTTTIKPCQYTQNSHH